MQQESHAIGTKGMLPSSLLPPSPQNEQSVSHTSLLASRCGFRPAVSVSAAAAVEVKISPSKRKECNLDQRKADTMLPAGLDKGKRCATTAGKFQWLQGGRIRTAPW